MTGGTKTVQVPEDFLVRLKAIAPRHANRSNPAVVAWALEKVLRAFEVDLATARQDLESGVDADMLDNELKDQDVDISQGGP